MENTHSVALLFSTINETNRCLEEVKIRHFYKVNNDCQNSFFPKLHMCDVIVPISDRGWELPRTIISLQNYDLLSCLN